MSEGGEGERIREREARKGENGVVRKVDICGGGERV